jgi:hypothetical protein
LRGLLAAGGEWKGEGVMEEVFRLREELLESRRRGALLVRAGDRKDRVIWKLREKLGLPVTSRSALSS